MSNQKGWWQNLSDIRVLTVACTIAASHGLNSLNDLSIKYLYKDDYHFSPAKVSMLSSFEASPWILKTFWGLITDNLPVFGYRRMSYIILFGIIGFIAHLTLATWSHIVALSILMIFMISFSLSFYNVIGEALLVESAQKFGALPGKTEAEKQNKASNNVSLFFSVRFTASIIASYLGGFLLDYITKKDVFIISSTVPFLVAVIGLVLPEKRVSSVKEPQVSVNSNEEDETQELIAERIQVAEPRIAVEEPSPFRKVWEFVKQPEIYKPLLLLFMFQITPDTSSATFFFYTNELLFPPTFMGTIDLAGSCAVVIGIFIYNRFLKNIPFKKIMLWSTLICFLLKLSQLILVTRVNKDLGIPDKLFCLGDSIIINVFSEINTIPMLVVVCRLCPKNIEGTMYALFISVFNLASIISAQLGAFFIWVLDIDETNFRNLWLLILISSSFMFVPLSWLHRVHFDAAINKTEQYQPQQDTLNEENMRKIVEFREANMGNL